MKATGRNSKKTVATGNTGMPPNGAPDIFSLPMTAWLNSRMAGILVMDENHRCIWVNDVFAQYMNGTSPVNLPYADLIRFFKPMVTEQASLEEKMETLRQDKTPWFGWKVPFRNGQIWEITYLPVFNGEKFTGSIWQGIDISRIEAGEIQVNQREFNLRELIQSLRHTFELKLGRRPVKITAELDANINTWLVGDDMLLNQILINLLGNAEKFTNEGEIVIKATRESWQDNKLWIRFRVCDTGIGIRKDKPELIFRNDNREKYDGTGLGLAIAKQLVEFQGGNISVEEIPEFNTCFSFNIPFMDSRRPLTANTGRLSRKLLQRSFEEARILIVEDNPMNLRYIMSLLEKYKINYQLATNGPDASYFLESRQYDLILLDIRIPGMNGLELAQKIRADENQPNVATPVIATTAVAMESTAVMARAAGITDILRKPYTPDQLLQVFNKYLNEEETELIMEEVQNLSGFEFNNDLDVKYLTDLYESNISYAADLFEIFIRTIRDEVDKLSIMVNNHEWEQMKFQVHKLKPNFAMVGLTWISNKMQELENYLRINQELHSQDITLLFKEIQEDVKKFYPLVEREYHKMKDFMDATSGE